MDTVKKVQISLILLVVLLSGGTLGYSQIEGWTLFESLYMTVITLATVGYSEVHRLSHTGQVFTIILIIFGVGTIAYSIGSALQFMVEGQLLQILGRKHLLKRIQSLQNHHIICGYGRIGRQISREFAARPLPFIVVENSPEQLTKLEEDGHLYIAGDATQDEILEQAGIHRARSLITAVTNDSANVFITLTARGMKPDLFILARAGEEGSQIKLLRAGASKVVSPYTIGAARMADAVLRPAVVDLLDIATGSENLELQIEEIPVAAGSILVDKSLIDAEIRKTFGLIIVGIIKAGVTTMTFNPAGDMVIRGGDTLIALGPHPQVQQFARIAAQGR